MSEAAAESQKEILFKGEVEKESRQLEDGRLLYLYRDLKNQPSRPEKKGTRT